MNWKSRQIFNESNKQDIIIRMNVTSVKEKITLPQATKDIRDIRFPGLPDNHLPQINTEDGIGYGEVRKIEEVVEEKKEDNATT